MVGRSVPAITLSGGLGLLTTGLCKRNWPRHQLVCHSGTVSLTSTSGVFFDVTSTATRNDSIVPGRPEQQG